MIPCHHMEDVFANPAQLPNWQAAADEKEKSLSWMEMKVDTVYGPQWTHPHPSYSWTENWVVYTSDVSGHSQVYAVEVGE